LNWSRAGHHGRLFLEGEKDAENLAKIGSWPQPRARAQAMGELTPI
jgi:hypothetical protein